MEPTKLFFVSLAAAAIFRCAVVRTRGESSTCLTVYKEGGAPAVFQSPKCPRWKLPNHASRPRTLSCQSAVHQGRRRSQEDRTLCALDIRIPFPGTEGLIEVTVGIVAVFDGHNGAEASEMASKLLLEYFVLHTYFLLDATYSFLLRKSTARLPSKGEQDVIHEDLDWGEELGWHGSDLERFTLPELSDGSFHLEILKKSLLRAIHDIDVTFSKEASRSNLASGSTATIILVADDHILVANVGDSKALLCSEKYQSPAEAKATLLRLYRQQRRNGAISHVKNSYRFKTAISDELLHFFVEELTRDHHPNRDDERSRVESAGGYVLEWGGVARVNGQLAVSRAIGDMFFKRYGVTSDPEVTDWQRLTTNDSYLVAASDGVFEKLSPQDLCDLLREMHSHGTVRSDLSSTCSNSMADCIVNTAFQKGSMDNMAAVVVPLRSDGSSQTLLKRRCDGEGDIDCSALGPQHLICERTTNDVTSDEVPVEHDHPIVAKLERLLVEGKHGDFGCFYLSENLNDNMESSFLVQKNDQYDLMPLLPVLNYRNVGPVNLYRDRNICLDFGMTTDGFNDQCKNPEGFANFLSLLESIPFPDTGSSYGTFENGIPDMRYTLRKRFDRGSYGEVWLALKWNCSQGYNSTCCRFENKNFPFNTSYHHSRDWNSERNSSCQNCQSYPTDELFILKRIMVERGTATYLSGLREKYYGEIFVNASRCLGNPLSAGMSNSYLNESKLDSYERVESMHVYEAGLNHIARYVESFDSRSNEVWLVFRHEGVSLSKLMYTSEEIENTGDEERGEGIRHIQVLHPSKWWHWLKTTDAGREEMRHLLWQLLKALKSCHDRHITHRDIKPENMVICFEDPETGRCLKGSPSEDKRYNTKMRIIDFGSAIDKYTMKHLYGPGPSRAEQTFEYTPPEALLNSSWYLGPMAMNMKYDMWSVGVVMLELILGSPNVFQLNALTRILLDPHLEGWNDGLKELAYKLRSFMELCILIPGSSSKHQRLGVVNDAGGTLASWKCSEEFFSLQVKSRDPLQLGFPNVLALRLVRQLLLWDPEERISVDDALQHPYFQPPPQS